MKCFKILLAGVLILIGYHSVGQIVQGQAATAQQTSSNIVPGPVTILNTATIGGMYIGFRNETTNTALGANVLNVGGVSNAAFGNNVLSLTGGGSANTAMGDRAMQLFLGTNNVAIGYKSMRGSFTGTDANPVGSPNNIGMYNAGVGFSSLGSIESGNNNSAFGSLALSGNKGGSNNTAIGYSSLSALTTGSDNNVAIGYNSLSGFTSGTNNVAIGANTQFFGNSGSNQLNIHNMIFGRNANTTGNIGIGVMPSASTGGIYPGTIARLDVNGILRLRNMIYINPPNTPGVGFLFVDGDGMVGKAPILPGGSINNIYENDGQINQATTTDGLNRVVNMNNRNIWFNTETSTANGRIYIGSNNAPVMFPTTTGNYRLYVEGGILTEKIKVAVRNSANWADNVFADDYKLMPIQKIEAFIKANKHLPGIEAAEDLVKKGLDIGEILAKQMGKIEELTLYIIEQDKKLDNQNAKLAKQNEEIETLKGQVKNLLEKNK